ncbi:MAG: terpene cyclase/mutase family protein [Phycisphaerae bacterium]|nr:terpene cyclase/mutase family protein [Phycisphaerae bacterium]
MKTRFIIAVLMVFMVVSVSFGQSGDQRYLAENKQSSSVKNLSLLNESRHSMETAFKYFAGTQKEDGSWMDDPAVTALVLYSYVLAPEYNPDAKTAEIIKKGYAFLEKNVKPNGGIYLHEVKYRNYSTAVCLLAFTEANKPEYKEIIKNAKNYLIQFQLDEGEDIAPKDAFYGGIGYGGDTRPDLSNLHLALEGIKAAEDLELKDSKGQVKPNEQKGEHWRKALVFLARTQNLTDVNKMDYATNDGGFIYETGHYDPERSVSYGSMTFAGLKSLLYAGVDKNDIRVKSAYAWLCDNYTVEENPHFGTTSLYYYFMTATKCLTAFGGDVIVDSKGKKHYWREDFIQKIISLQHEDGYWVNPNGRYQENIKDLATAYSVIAIKYSLNQQAD